MVSRRLASKAGLITGVGVVVSSFGVVTPAQAYTCDITIDPVRDDLVNAVNDGNSVICINSGTLDFGLGAPGENPPILIDHDLTLVGLGDVVVDGNNEAPAFVVGSSETSAEIALTVDNLTVRDFNDWGYSQYESGQTRDVPIVGLAYNTTGTVTVLNSRFESNDSYVASVGAIDQGGDWDFLGAIVVDNTVFDDNNAGFGQVWGYSDIAVTNSTFTDNYSANVSSAIEVWSTENTWEDSFSLVAGNYFAGNESPNESTIYLDASNASIYNNTFAWNSSGSGWAGSAIASSTDASYVIAYNTFHENHSNDSVGSVSVGDNMEAVLTGNVFSTLDGEPAITAVEDTTFDRGGNVSTADDSATLDADSSLNSVGEEELLLEEPTDNGGPTFTMALGADSVARDLMESSVVANELGPDLAVDQRGETRGDLVDSGAWDSGDGELAATGVDAPGIALIGGLVGAAGVAIAARRRRTS